MFITRHTLLRVACLLVLALTSAPAPADGAADAYARIAADADAVGAPAVQGKEDWLFLASEVRHLGRGPFWGENAPSAEEDPVNAITDLAAKLRELGIELLLCPAPPRAVIYADKLLNDVATDKDGIPLRADPTLQTLYDVLRTEGVTVVDVTDAFLEARRDDATKGTICCKQDTHWSPRGLELAAATVAKVVTGNALIASPPKDGFTVQPPETLSYVGDLVGRVDGHTKTKTEDTIRRVTDDKAGSTPLAFDPESPVLLLADSHGLVFSVGDDMHCTAAGFGEHLSAALGFRVDRMARRGSGDQVRIDLARRFLRDATQAPKKKVLVYTFAARTFTESTNWKVVPLKR